jgi:hypothetical protein
MAELVRLPNGNLQYGNLQFRFAFNAAANPALAALQARITGALELGFLAVARGAGETPEINALVADLNPDGPPRTIDFYSDANVFREGTRTAPVPVGAAGAAIWRGGDGQWLTSGPVAQRTDMRIWIDGLDNQQFNFGTIINNVWHEIKHLVSNRHHGNQRLPIPTPDTTQWEAEIRSIGAEIASTVDPSGRLTIQEGGRVKVIDPINLERQFIIPERWVDNGHAVEQSACFLAGTPVLFPDGTERPIESVRVGDLVAAFDPAANDGVGILRTRRVKRLFHNTASAVIDLRGLRLTPGHVCLTDGGGFATIAAILVKDGVLVSRNGDLIRARTGAALGTPEDAPIRILYADPNTGEEARAEVRGGIPCITRCTANGGLTAVSLVGALAERGFSLRADGQLETPDGRLCNFCDWPAGSTPFDTETQRNWILSIGDGALHTPPWIAELLKLAETEDAQRVNQSPMRRSDVALPGSGFRPHLVGSFFAGRHW